MTNLVVSNVTEALVSFANTPLQMMYQDTFTRNNVEVTGYRAGSTTNLLGNPVHFVVFTDHENGLCVAEVVNNTTSSVLPVSCFSEAVRTHVRTSETYADMISA